MRRFIPYIVKTLWRHWTRTLLTVSGTAIALFVFSFVTAVQEGLERLTQDQTSARSLIVFQANRFCPSTSKLPEDYVRQISKLSGVREAIPLKIYMNNCRASLDVVVFNGIPAKQLKSARDFQLLKGDWGQFESQRDAALVGRAVAQRRRLDIGQRFSIGMLTVTVSGIFESPLQSDENMIYTHLEFLQRTKGLNSVGTVTQIEVSLTPEADPNSVAKAIDHTFRGGPVGTNTRPKGVFQSKAVGDLIELIGFMRLLGYACVGLVLMLVTTTTIMSVQDRVKEHAILQTIGCTGYRIFGFVMCESVIISTIGGLLGVATSLIVLHWSSLALGAEGVMIAFQPSISIAITGTMLSFVVGIFAGIVPAWQAARADIVTALRFA